MSAHSLLVEEESFLQSAKHSKASAEQKKESSGIRKPQKLRKLPHLAFGQALKRLHVSLATTALHGVFRHIYEAHTAAPETGLTGTQKAFIFSSYSYCAQRGEQLKSWAHVLLCQSGHRKPAIKSAVQFTAGSRDPHDILVNVSAIVWPRKGSPGAIRSAQHGESSSDLATLKMLSLQGTPEVS